jgi:hypothetical protein
VYRIDVAYADMVYGEVSISGEKYSSFFSEKLIKIGLHIMTLLR